MPRTSSHQSHQANPPILEQSSQASQPIQNCKPAKLKSQIGLAGLLASLVAESSNRMTETRSRNMLIAAPDLPKALWPYAARYAVELLNHYPTTAVPCGKTPRQMLLEHMKVVNPLENLDTSTHLYRSASRVLSFSLVR
jgi:hypothetical protein